jgi:hypothetical protein
MKPKRKPRGARVEWMKCDCPSPIAFGLFMRCPTCGFLFRDEPHFNPKEGGSTLRCLSREIPLRG